MHQQDRDQARVQAAGTDHHQLRFRDRPLRFGQRGNVVGHEPDPPDPPAGGRDPRFPVNMATVGQLRQQAHIRPRGGEHGPLDVEELPGPLHGRGEAILEAAQGRQDEVAQAVAGEAIVSVEAEVEHGGRPRVLGQGHEAVSDVAGGEDSVGPAQTAGTAAVVGDGDERRQQLASPR